VQRSPQVAVAFPGRTCEAQGVLGQWHSSPNQATRARRRPQIMISRQSPSLSEAWASLNTANASFMTSKGLTGSRMVSSSSIPPKGYSESAVRGVLRSENLESSVEDSASYSTGAGVVQGPAADAEVSLQALGPPTVMVVLPWDSPMRRFSRSARFCTRKRSLSALPATLTAIPVPVSDD
jgi:hypothetical protein